MIRQLRYVNSKGDEVKFGGDSHWEYGSMDLFDLDLEYREVGGRITSFHAGIREASLDVRMVGGSLAERNRFIDVVSYDAAVNRHGTLYAGGSYMKCFIGGFGQSRMRMRDSVIEEHLKVVTDMPAWIREKSVALIPANKTTIGGLEYPYDYPHDYLLGDSSTVDIANPFQLPCSCDIVFPGPCHTPYVRIAGNTYMVDEQVDKGDLLIIRGFAARPDVVVRSSDGSERSVLHKASIDPGNGADAFAQIPVGTHTATWSGTTAVQVTMYEERRSPWFT